LETPQWFEVIGVGVGGTADVALWDEEGKQIDIYDYKSGAVGSGKAAFHSWLARREGPYPDSTYAQHALQLNLYRLMKQRYVPVRDLFVIYGNPSSSQAALIRMPRYVRISTRYVCVYGVQETDFVRAHVSLCA
jgi:hypothetical protein